MRIISDSEHEANLKNFETEQWESLGHDERLKALQKLEDRMAQEQGRTAREVKEKDLDRDTLGQFDRDNPDYVFINKEYLHSKDDSIYSSYSAVDTVMHEGYHAYQFDVTHHRIEDEKHLPNEDTAREWKENNAIRYAAREDSTRYRFQSKEDSANKFAQDKMVSYAKYFDGDQQYHKYMAKESNMLKTDENKAQKRFGKNFREKINEEIRDRYNEREKSIETPKIEPKMDLETLQAKYVTEKRQSQAQKFRAKRMEQRVGEMRAKDEEITKLSENRKDSPQLDSEIQQMENSSAQAHEFFKKAYNVTLAEAPEAIKQMRNQSEEVERKLETDRAKIEDMQEQERQQRGRDDNTISYGDIEVGHSHSK